MAEKKAPECFDCIAEGVNNWRAPVAGAAKKRCYLHNRAWKRSQRNRSHDVYVQRRYGLRPGEYVKLKEAFGGRCALCQKATGAARALALEHDHGHCTVCATGTCCGEPEAIRGVACGPCNQVIGRFSIATLNRMAAYLVAPPGPAIIRAIREEPS